MPLIHPLDSKREHLWTSGPGLVTEAFLGTDASESLEHTNLNPEYCLQPAALKKGIVIPIEFRDAVQCMHAHGVHAFSGKGFCVAKKKSFTSVHSCTFQPT